MKNPFKKNEFKLKGIKKYSIASKNGSICFSKDNPQMLIRHLDENWPYIVEVQVTRVFTIETELKETELDQIN